jgi:hypothetical protein
MIADSFDSRTLANMEVALERACKILSIGAGNMRFVGTSPAKSSNAQRVAIERSGA